ncbi:aminotransferase class I/II-fold pyridoxal phosphate-dependent enzyme [Sphingobacterium daejeonense]|uniref:aminotransferase class I/II-fold pyridoxal phosphate-dependent enzyme n=1 Tax=Sphingobacterium daejeonense TaxID=371142 RepID=UPI0010C4F7EB|nr:aminotransferase class I/II-fold pyridoxal phosphate-dependent enzyme [Sphingobacterium daejeonense]VTP91641.1 2-aminoadipate transaminase [Sphingobacterium daejeonense]
MESANSVSYGSDLALPFNIIDKEATGHPTISPTITIDDGCPDVRLCPIDTLLKTYRSLTSRNYGITNANTSTGQGTIKFREELANYLSLTRGLNISAENLLVTHGAQMSIYLSAQLLLGLSKKVIVGKPNYPIANKTFGQTGAEIIEVNVDQNGIDTDAIERICKNSKVDAVYVIPITIIRPLLH